MPRISAGRPPSKLTVAVKTARGARRGTAGQDGVEDRLRQHRLPGGGRMDVVRNHQASQERVAARARRRLLKRSEATRDEAAEGTGHGRHYLIDRLNY